MSYNVRFLLTYHQARFEESTFGHKIFHISIVFWIYFYYRDWNWCIYLLKSFLGKLRMNLIHFCHYAMLIGSLLHKNKKIDLWMYLFESEKDFRVFFVSCHQKRMYRNLNRYFCRKRLKMLGPTSYWLWKLWSGGNKWKSPQVYALHFYIFFFQTWQYYSISLFLRQGYKNMTWLIRKPIKRYTRLQG